MATNHYFSNYSARNEQRLYEDLIVESIKIMGFDGYYLPNDNNQARDLLYGEDPIKKFKSAYPLEMYLSDALDYTGEKEFFSKFGLEIKNNIKVVVSRRSFDQRVPKSTFFRPREGDLIYVPVLNQVGELFEITFVDQNKDMAILGRPAPYFYEIQLEKFKYSQEVIDTGLPDIDIVVTDSAYTIDFDIGTGTGNYKAKELVFQSADSTLANATCSATVSSWNALSSVLSVTNVTGEFVNGETIIGSTSNAQYELISYDTLDVNVRNENYDNKLIRNDANSIIDFSETNPFGLI